VGGAKWKAAQAQKAADAAAKQTKKTASERAVWEKKRVDLRAAESALAAADGEPSRLSVKMLQALIFSRTGHRPTAKNNRDDALVLGGRAALDKGRTTLLPPTPPRTLALDDDDDEDYRCPSCLTAGDNAPDKNGMIWCEECGHRLDEPYEGDE
jgi:DNA-directed RNA polymerase subunit RPC12/RpoP